MTPYGRTGKLGTPLRLSNDSRPEMIRNRNGSPVAEAVSLDVALTLIEYANERDALRGYVEEIKKLASDPFASDAVALRACLLAANEALGLPGPEPSPERDIARAIIREDRGTS